MDAHELGGLWVLREMWDFPSGVPEDDRVDYLKAIMACAHAGTGLAPAEKDWVIGYGAACGAHQATIDALERYDGDEDVVAILERNMPVADTWGGLPSSTPFERASADAAYSDDERAAVRREASRLGSRRRGRCCTGIPVPTRARAQERQDCTGLRRCHSLHGQG